MLWSGFVSDSWSPRCISVHALVFKSAALFAKKLLLEGDVDRLEMRAGEGNLCIDYNNRNGNRND